MDQIRLHNQALGSPISQPTEADLEERLRRLDHFLESQYPMCSTCANPMAGRTSSPTAHTHDYAPNSGHRRTRLTTHQLVRGVQTTSLPNLLNA